jgi:hypothetical protein
LIKIVSVIIGLSSFGEEAGLNRHLTKETSRLEQDKCSIVLFLNTVRSMFLCYFLNAAMRKEISEVRTFSDMSEAIQERTIPGNSDVSMVNC